MKANLKYQRSSEEDNELNKSRNKLKALIQKTKNNKIRFNETFRFP